MAVVEGTFSARLRPSRSRAGTFVWTERIDVLVELLVLAACVSFVFVQLNPGLLLRNTTPSGGDTAAHVWWPAYLRDHLLPFRLAGWSPDFYAGFAAGQYYFPVPALIIVALDLLVPYNVAFKLVTALGPMLLPVGAYILGRGLRAPRPVPAGLAVAAVGFLFFNGSPVDQSVSFNQHIMGGTLASNLAGEFSFTLALAFALAFLGMFAYSLRTGDRPWIAALLFAAALMSHIVVGIFAVIGGIVVWIATRPLRNLKRAVAIGGVGALLTAVWSLPLIKTLGFTTDMRYDPIVCPAAGACAAYQNPSSYLFTRYLPWGAHGWLPWQWFDDFFPGAALMTVVAIAAVVIRRGRRSRATLALVALTGTFGLLFRFWPEVSTTVWNLRFLPFWYLGLFMLMAVGIAELLRGAGWLARRVATEPGITEMAPRIVGKATTAVLVLALTVGVLVSINDESNVFLKHWVSWNYRGYEDAVGSGLTPKKQTAEYRAIVNAVGELPPGRLVWEGNSQLNVYGSPLALMLLPYWTHGRISSMEGVYYEASATTPYHFMTVAALVTSGNASNAVRGLPYRDESDFRLGVRWLQLMGVRYLAVHSPEAKQRADGDPRLRLVTTSPDLDQAPPLGWSVYRVSHSAIVAPLDYEPVVVTDPSAKEDARCLERVKGYLGPGPAADHLHVHEWQDCIAVPWFNSPRALARPLVADGPARWERASPSKARGSDRTRLPTVRVTRIKSDDSSISFHVSRTGVPVYVKTSFFPNWKVEGARGPYRATPNFMVVEPTSHDVKLTYATTGTEWLGRLGTLLGLLGLSVLAFGAWWRRRAKAGASEARN